MSLHGRDLRGYIAVPGIPKGPQRGSQSGRVNAPIGPIRWKHH
ncbi:hypothetical protein HMPREF0742_00466 [Rothia aeria F0184]|uniref:Uncharacterized protein n=1 Tax=Rothia aeria F0184 TaxID=888019 RepID=U7V6A7_9MICC|nr:hypothetical protein HMPREF0742_00466 [Rothia aeria F0184]